MPDYPPSCRIGFHRLFRDLFLLRWHLNAVRIIQDHDFERLNLFANFTIENVAVRPPYVLSAFVIWQFLTVADEIVVLKSENRKIPFRIESQLP